MAETVPSAPVVEAAPIAAPPAVPTTQEPTNASSSTQAPTHTLPTEATTAPAPAPSETPKADVPEQLFELEIEGEKKSFKANELVDYTQEKIEAALNIHDRYVEGMKAFAENPLQTALDAMAATRFGGDKGAAYQELIKLCDQVLSEEMKYRALPEDKRKALEYEQEAKATRAELKKRDDAERSAREKYETAQRANAILAQMNSAMKEFGLEDSQDVRLQVRDEMVREQRSGLVPDAIRAAKKVKEKLESFDKSREEVALKKIDLEFLRKHRPELLKAAQEAALEETRQARDDAEKKARGEPAPREKPPVGRILPSNRFASADW